MASRRGRSAGHESEVVRLRPYEYIHVHNNNEGTTRTVVGPATFTRQEHEEVVTSPRMMVVIPPRHYCVVRNPVARAPDGTPLTDRYGQLRVRTGDTEVRLSQEPFPLHPHEELVGEVKALDVLQAHSALRLRALRDFTEEAKGEGEHRLAEAKRQAGDEWLFVGPGTYVPRVEVEVVDRVQAQILGPNNALRIRARNSCTDHQGNPRKVGEEWLVREMGAYLPGVEEEVVETVRGQILTINRAIHVEAIVDFVDVFGKERKAGSRWLLTCEDAPVYIPTPNERVVNDDVKPIQLSSQQWCVVMDPWVDGHQQFGTKEVRKGLCSFFAHPGEKLEGGNIRDVYNMSEDEALLLSSREQYVEEGPEGRRERCPGDRWMIYGPRAYVPPVEVQVVEKRSAFTLDANEGIYVRCSKTGQVRAVMGQKRYMLAAHEELYNKEVPPTVELLLALQGALRVFRVDAERPELPPRNPTQVITYKVPYNSICQVYNYSSRTARIVYGPDLVCLQPDEEFTVVTLSGDTPKKQNVIHTLAVTLGPDFMTDMVQVETADHARLSLRLAYNWHFEVERFNPEHAAQVFSVPDFVGDACKAIASRVRGAVAQETFDSFHRNAQYIIRAAVFGLKPSDDPNASPDIGKHLRFRSNRLVVDNIGTPPVAFRHIQAVQPVDQRTRESLQKSVQLAIEITTKSQEADAKHEAEKREQQARGRLERQRLEDQAKCEAERQELKSLQSTSAAIESTGTSQAAALAKAKAIEIETEASVQKAQCATRAETIMLEVETQLEEGKRKEEREYQRLVDEIEIENKRALAEVEKEKVRRQVAATGPDTIAALARSGPEVQGRLLKALGLRGYLVTDGSNPVNLFGVAQGLAQGASGAIGS